MTLFLQIFLCSSLAALCFSPGLLQKRRTRRLDRILDTMEKP